MQIVTASNTAQMKLEKLSNELNEKTTQNKSIEREAGRRASSQPSDSSQISTNRAYYEVLIKKLGDVEATAALGQQIKERLDAQKGAQDKVLDGLRKDFAQLAGVPLPRSRHTPTRRQSIARHRSWPSRLRSPASKPSFRVS